MNLKHHLKLDKFYRIKFHIDSRLAKPVECFMRNEVGEEIDLYQHGEKKTGNVVKVSSDRHGHLVELNCGHTIGLSNFHTAVETGKYFNCPVCANIAGEARLQNETLKAN